jgi:hypothetical protein
LVTLKQPLFKPDGWMTVKTKLVRNKNREITYPQAISSPKSTLLLTLPGCSNIVPSAPPFSFLLYHFLQLATLVLAGHISFPKKFLVYPNK